MNKVYIKRKMIKEEVSITDPALAQQYLVVKTQIADKQTKKDQQMKIVNQLDNEINILNKNLIAIETKANAQQTQKQQETKPETQQQTQPAAQPAQTTQQTQTTPPAQQAKNESYLRHKPVTKPSTRYNFISFKKEVKDILDKETKNSDVLMKQYGTFSDLYNTFFQKNKQPRDAANYIMKSANIPTKEENESYIGGDTYSKFNAGMTTPVRVAESLESYLKK